MTELKNPTGTATRSDILVLFMTLAHMLAFPETTIQEGTELLIRTLNR